MFERYIYAPTRHRVTHIIRMFCEQTGLPNMVGAIDGTHIPLASKSQRGLTPMPCDFFQMKKFHNMLSQAVCNSKRIFWNFCVGQPGRKHDVAQFAWSGIYAQLRSRDVLSELVFGIGAVEAWPFGDSLS